MREVDRFTRNAKLILGMAALGSMDDFVDRLDRIGLQKNVSVKLLTIWFCGDYWNLYRYLMRGKLGFHSDRFIADNIGYICQFVNDFGLTPEDGEMFETAIKHTREMLMRRYTKIKP